VQRELNGHNYYEFEYTAKNPRYTRHSLAVVVANDGEAHHTQPWQPQQHWWL
jgi:hypothetical protein